MCTEIRFRRAVRGWFTGCVMVTAIIYLLLFGLFAIIGGGHSINSIGAGLFIVLVPPTAILTITCALTGIPAALVVWLSERLRMRSFLFFGCAGGVIGALSQGILSQSLSSFAWFFVGLGFLAGLDYWFVAGRYAGDDPVT
jgi:hypothetical protein